MKTSLKDIENILQAEDVEGLIGSGAPGDEYNSEAEQIASAVAFLDADKRTATSITAIISLAWAKSFNLSEQQIRQRLPAFQRVVHRLFAS